MRGRSSLPRMTAPRLLPFLCLGNLAHLPAWSKAPTSNQMQGLKDAGFVGIQGGPSPDSRAVGLIHAAGGRVDRVGEAARLAATWKSEGHVCATLHVGSGHEDDAQIDALVRDILAASRNEGLPLYIETHRATITQDTWRTVRLIERNPDVRINADFSHWYTGLEMVYGDWEAKLAFLQPVFDRVRFFHGRIGNSGAIQMPLSHPSMPKAIGHFRDLWTRAMRGFRRTAAAGEDLIFSPELLFPAINYAPTWPCPNGSFDEASDRWQEALELVRIAQECWQASA
jgi:hypothetical protein